MAAYIAIFLSIISIVLLITVIFRFNKLFSTESIIEKTKVQMNKIISDINKNANMDIDLINEATKRTRTLMAEADAKMDEFKEAADILRDMIATVEKQNKTSPEQSHIYGQSGRVDDVKPMRPASMNVVNAYGGNVSSYKVRAYKPQYTDSFDDNDLVAGSSDDLENKDNLNENKLKDNNLYENRENENILSSEPQQGEYMIPKIVTNIIPDDSRTSKKSLNDKVERLFRAGMNVDDIAVELSCSSSEVQFIIDMLVQPEV